MNTTSRWLIGACVALSIPVPTLAAEPARFGIKGGIAIANVSREIGTVAQFDHKLGPGGGAFATWALNDRVALGAEVLYVSKGLSLGESVLTDNSGTAVGTIESLWVTDYLEVPMLVRVGLGGGTMRPAIVLGPAIAFKVRERLVTTGDQRISSKTDAFARTDYGMAAGAELRLRSGPGWSLMEARYTLGLVDVAFYGRQAKNRALTVMAGYAF